MDRALGYIRRVATETDDVPVRSLANEWEYTCDAVHIRFTPYSPNVRGSAPPHVLPGGMAAALGIRRTLSCIAQDATCVDGSFLRTFDAGYEYLAKYNLPTTKGNPSNRRLRRPGPLVQIIRLRPPLAHGLLPAPTVLNRRARSPRNFPRRP